MVVIQAKELQAAINRVAHAADKNASVETFKTICFRNGLVSAFNGRVGIVTKSPLATSEFDCCVPADRIQFVVNGLADDINLSMTGSTLVLRSGRNKTQLQTIGADRFPDILPTSVWDFYSGDDLNSVIDLVEFCSSVATSGRQQFSGIGVRWRYVYATDGLRAARAELKQPINGEAVIPLDAIKTVMKFGKADKVSRNDNVLSFVYHGSKTVVIAAMSAGIYPFDAIDRQVSAQVRPEYDCVLPEDTVASVSRVSRIAGSKSTQEIMLKSDGGLLIRCSESEAGVSEELLPWSFASPFEVYVDGTLFREAVVRTRKVNLTDVVEGKKNHLRFFGDGFDHLLALRVH